MKFESSAEVSLRAHPALATCQKYVDPFIKAELAASSLAALECTLRYVPIIMSEDMKSNYPERSKVHINKRAYDCAPILDYDVFVCGTLEDYVREYLRGLGLCAPHLATFGASSQQIREFEGILASGVAHVVAEQQSEQTQH